MQRLNLAKDEKSVWWDDNPFRDTPADGVIPLNLPPAAAAAAAGASGSRNDWRDSILLRIKFVNNVRIKRVNTIRIACPSSNQHPNRTFAAIAEIQTPLVRFVADLLSRLSRWRALRFRLILTL